MNSPDVVAARRAGAPDAAEQLYDAHAEGLYQYCWLMLLSREKAQMAVRNAVILAGARIDELTDPPMLKAWLFAIARAECERHGPGSSGESDEPVAHPQQRDAARRIMAWRSAISLPAGEREALDLVTRHRMTPPEVALVLGTPAAAAPALIAVARQHLEQALAAEILINRESQECAGRADARPGWTGTVTPAVRERLLRHARSCPACAPRLPRHVSAAKIFGLLPQPALTEGGWAGVLSRLSDPDPADAPASLTTDARPAGAPGRAHPRSAGGGASRRRRGRRLYAGIGAAVAAAGAAAVLAAGNLGGHTAVSGPARNRPGVADAPAQAAAGRPVPHPDSAPATPATSRRPAGSSSLAVSAGDGAASGSPGWPAPATATSFAATAARTPQRASNVASPPGPAPGEPQVSPVASGASPQNPAGASSASPAPGEPQVSPTSLGTGSYGQAAGHRRRRPGRHRPPSPSPAASQRPARWPAVRGGGPPGPSQSIGWRRDRRS